MIFKLDANAASLIADLQRAASDVSRLHDVAIGVAEMAAGAALLTYGIKSGAIQMAAGSLVGTSMPSHRLGREIGVAGGASVGLFAGHLIGSIGIAGAFGALAVPASVLAGGAAFVLSCCGYSIGSAVDALVTAVIEAQRPHGGLPALAGAALLLSGAMRIAGEERLDDIRSWCRGRIVHLAMITAPVVVTTLTELRRIAGELASPPRSRGEATGDTGALLGGGIVGAGLGHSVATASVTVFGSHAIGSVALALGVVSAPVLPVVIGAAVAAGLTYSGWRICHRRGVPGR